MENRFPDPQNKKKDFFIQKMLLKGKRRSKRAQVKESFCCECGKIYLSFSALYLHSKNKHDFKLTTKLSDDVCRVERAQGFVRYTFYIVEMEKDQNGKEKGIQANSCQIQPQKVYGQSKQQNLDQICQKYFNEYFKILQINQEEQTVKKFIKFAMGRKDQKQKPLQEQIKSLPIFLNEFMQEQIPNREYVNINTQEWKSMCKYLQNFALWMFDTSLTDLYVINQAY